MSSSKPFSSSRWTEWGSYANKLRVAIKSNCSETDLCRLIAECRSMYEDHLCVPSIDGALAVISGYGCSALEIAFMWMGRWRPTSAIVLVYSTMGVDLKGTNKEFEDIMLLVEQDAVAALRLGETCSVEITDMSDFQRLLDVKLKELQALLQKADMLRLHTLRVLLDLLSPVQAASCMVAAYELILALRSLSQTLWNTGG
eukprot:c23438_g1_i3 orf=389-988(+)